MCRLDLAKLASLCVITTMALSACDSVADSPPSAPSRLTFDAQPSGGQEEDGVSCDAAFLAPPGLADGDTDGAPDDKLIERHEFANTIIEVWCINGGPGNGDLFVALKVDGDGRPFRFVAKCSWEFGSNKMIPTHRLLANTLTSVEYRSTDGSGTKPDGTPYTGTMKTWVYTYDVAKEKLVAEKLDKDGKRIDRKEVDPVPTEPFKYENLPGGGDPIACSLQPTVFRVRGRRHDPPRTEAP